MNIKKPQGKFSFERVKIRKLILIFDIKNNNIHNS